MEQLEIATVFLSEESNVSISAVLPIVHGLVSKLATEADDSSHIAQFKTHVSAALKRRWGLDSLDSSELSLLTTAVDPRFRNLKFLSEVLRHEVKLELLRLALSVQETLPSVEGQPS